MTTRRTFVRTSAAALTGAMLPRWSAGMMRGERIERVGVQLYTVRAEMERNLEDTLARVAEIGYKEVEFAGYFGRSPEQVRSTLERLGLSSPSSHMAFEDLGEHWSRVLDTAKSIGHEYVVVAWTPAEQRRTMDDWKRIADKFNHAGEQTKRAGLTFAYHNHDFEFTPIDGHLPFDLLMERTDPSLVKLEMDLYWITLAGGDPFFYFAKYPGRFPMVHVKDLKRGAKPPMVDVGAGNIDFKAIFTKHKEAGIEHYFVEHDEPASPFDSISASYRYLKQLDF
ncbi:MAG: sugar phosphate isomerase/epimerase [Gemmatimonadota bacterium]